MSLLTNFDHHNLPVGSDGTAFGYFDDIQHEAIENGTSVGWSEHYDGFWIPTAYEVGKQIWQSPEIFSNRLEVFPEYATPNGRPFMLSQYDEPEHSRYRSLMQRPFSVAAAQALTDTLRSSANMLIDGFIDEGRVDIVKVFTDQVPGRMTAILLGLNEDDGNMYRSWTRAMGHLLHTDPERAHQLLEDKRAYFVELLADRRANPGGEDLMSIIVDAELDGVGLTDEEIEDFFTVLLLGGIDNTTILFADAIWRMGWDKTLRRQLAQHPELIPGAVEEFLRLYAPASIGRELNEDITIGGVDMKKGDKLLLSPMIFNRDPREFDMPLQVNPERRPNRHVALGLGIHRCIGAHLIRVEARVVLEELLRRIPVWEIDPGRNIHFLTGQVCGLDSVPIVFPAGGGYPDSDWNPMRELERIGA